MVTARSIIEYLQKQVEEKKNLPKEVWLDAALKLTILSFDEIDKLVDMEQKLGQKKVEMYDSRFQATSPTQIDLTKKPSVAEVELRTEGTQEYADVKKQRAFCKVIEEMIRVAKLSARLNEFV